MDRFILTDAQWVKMEPHCLGKPTDPGRTGSDNRMFLEAVLWTPGQVVRGVIFPRCLAIGTRSSPVTAIG